MLEGRSGGRHEIDVMATKADGVTTFKVFVECKAWNVPIEKDVVTKAAYVINDLGFNKGIVVSLAGVRVGAVKSAEQLGPRQGAASCRHATPSRGRAEPARGRATVPVGEYLRAFAGAWAA